jgi:tripartite-type tricarboxylate transporter receptor subunit TctC
MQRRTLLAATGAALLAGAAQAQDFPVQPLRIIVPFGPGGSNDVLGRLVAERLGARWQKPFVTENRPGAAGNIGAEAVARAAPDGHTWLLAPNQIFCTNPHLTRSNFDALRDLAIAARVARVQTLLVVHPDLPVREARELVALAQQRPGALSYPSSGIGSFQHLGVAGLVGENMVHVPYTGAGALLPDLLAGRTQVFCGALNSLLPHVRAGTLRAIAAMTPTRAALLPEVPSIVEAGFPDAVTEIWASVALPAATPRPIIAQVHAALAALFAEPEVVARLNTQGIEAAMLGPDEITTLARREFATTGALLQRLGLRAG